MKLRYQKLDSESSSKTFFDFWVKSDAFGVHWHYHPEIELCYIKKGRGQRIIGDSVHQFIEDDLVLVGSNLPHTWITNDIFNKSEEEVEVYVIQFQKENLFSTRNSAFKAIGQLLKNAKRGITFKDVDKPKLIAHLMKIEEGQNEFDKVISLYELLHVMTQLENLEYLASPFYNLESNHKAEARITKVCDFIYNNYREQIQVDEIADLINMNKASFCRFFKRNTGKTCVNFINDLRINFASNLLLDSNVKIYEVAYDSGFQSLTHFNKTFKRKMQKTPVEFQQSYSK